MRRQVYVLIDRVKYCSPLGSIVRAIRGSLRNSNQPTAGIGTIRKLETVGVTTLRQVAAMDVDDLVAAGIQKRFAKQIRAYIQRRLS